MKHKIILFFSIILAVLAVYYNYRYNKALEAQNAENLSFQNGDVELKYGEQLELNIKTDSTDIKEDDVIWSSSNPQLVEVDSTGKISVVDNKKGEAIIEATSTKNENSTSIKVNVSEEKNVVEVTDIELEKKSLTLNYGTSAKVVATVLPSNATNKFVTWKSSNEDLITVDKDGNISAIANKDGIATVTATTVDGKKQATVKVTVKKIDTTVKVTGIKLNITSVTLKNNQIFKLTATVSPSNATNKSVTWSSSNKDLVSVDSNGNIKAIANKDGIATVTATTVDGKKQATIKVTVKKVSTTVKVTGIKISGEDSGSLYLNKTNTKKLTATVSPSNATNKGVTWASSNTSVATVDSSGKITAKSIGTTTITVKTNDGSYKDTYKLDVKQKAIVVITASAGVRMNKWFKSYTSKNGNYYSKSQNTLKYVYESGSGFEFQTGDGLKQAKTYINEKYGNKKEYVELSVFFTLTGNSVKELTCDGIKSSNDYNEFATKYNNSVKEIINLGYKNTKGYVLSHNPINSKDTIKNHSEENKKWKIVYSTDSKACDSGYRSAYKYWISNKKMQSLLATGNYKNIKFVDNYSNIVVLTNESKRDFTWKKNSEGTSYDKLYKSEDGLHWDEYTTKIYMQLAFDTAGM